MSERTTTRIRKGTVLDGRFELLEPLGEGGFATVYKGRQLNIDRTVAIKVLDVNPQIPDEELENYRKRFFLEAKRAANIDHPDIVSIYDYGVMGEEQPYIVMELLQGRDLGEELAAYGPMAPERAIPLFVRCLDALQAAHDVGIVHKDLKPSNLFLTGVGTLVETLRIVDFGIAGLVDPKQDERMTSTGQYIGTALYCAPEYYEHSTVLPALDVYQMGLILAEVLVGRPAVNASSPVRAIMHHLAGALSLPEVLRDSTLGPLIAKATELDHKARYQNAGEFRDALSKLDPTTVGDVRQPERSLAEMETGTLSSGVVPDMLKTPTRPANTTPSPFAETRVASKPADPSPVTPPSPLLEEVATQPAAPLASKPPMGVVVAGIAILLVSVMAGAGLVVYFSDSEETASPTMEKTNLPPRGDSVSQPPPPIKHKPAAKAVAEKPDEASTQTPNESDKGEQAPVVEEKREPVVVFLKVAPKKARVEALTKGVVPGEDGDRSWVFDDKAPAPPWEFKVTGKGRKTAYLRLEPKERLKDRLSIVFGGEGEDKGIEWKNTHKEITLEEGRYEIVVKLEPSRARGGSRNNLKNAVPK